MGTGDSAYIHLQKHCKCDRSQVYFYVIHYNVDSSHIHFYAKHNAMVTVSTFIFM